MARGMVLQGGAELELALKALQASVAGRALADATLTGAGPMLADMYDRVPVKTGKLQSSLVAEVVASDRDHAEVVIGSVGNPVAHLVEFGHALVKGGAADKGGKVVGTVPPHPFVRPAYDGQKQATVDALGAQLKQNIDAVVGT